MICPKTRFHFQDSESFHALVQIPIKSATEEAGGDLCLHKKLQILCQYIEMISCCFPGATNVAAFRPVPPHLRELRLCPWYHRSHSNKKIVERQDQVVLEIQYDPMDDLNTAQGPQLRLFDLQDSKQVGGTKTRKANKGISHSKGKGLRACGKRTRKNLEKRCFSHSLEASSPIRIFLDSLHSTIRLARRGASASSVVSVLVCHADEYQPCDNVPIKLIYQLVNKG